MNAKQTRLALAAGFVLSVGALAQAAPKYVWEYNAAATAYDSQMSASDLINGLPAASILLNTDLSADWPIETYYTPIDNNGDGCAPTPINSPNTGITGFHSGVHPDAVAQKVKLVDGAHGANADSVLTDFAWPAAVFQFDLASPISIGEIRVFAANSNQDGRVFQDYDVEISTDTTTPTRRRTFVPLIREVMTANYTCAGGGGGDGFFPNVNNGTQVPKIGSTMTRVFDDANPVLASGVTSIRFIFYPVSNTQTVFWDRWLGPNGCSGLACGQIDAQDHDGFKRPIEAPVINEIDVLAARGTFEICDNGTDDDGDTLIDAADNDCFGRSCPKENCTNGIDDTGEGCIDCQDPDCSGAVPCSPEICDNDIDDNGDTLVDCQDPQCAEFQACRCHDPFADADDDRDVDQDDFGIWQLCFTGMTGPVPTELAYCRCFDRDNGGVGDDDVDQEDFNAFQACTSGPTILAAPACDGGQ